MPLPGQSAKRRLILHAGAPKTGSSSLQRSLVQHQLALKSQGILYPSEGLWASPSPKHQWIVQSLLADSECEFDRRRKIVEQECDEDTHTIILSTEGVFNHWWDYGANARRWFSKLSSCYNVCIWLWLRDPVDFFKSYYLQNMRNPQIAEIPAYGRDKTAADLLDMDWVAKRLDYQRFCREVESAFGAGSLFVFAYTPNIVADAWRLLGVALDQPEIRENATALNDAGLSVLKVVNRYPLDWKEKDEAYQLALRIGMLIGERSKAVTLTEAECARIRELCSMTHEGLLQISRQHFERWMTMFGLLPVSH